MTTEVVKHMKTFEDVPGIPLEHWVGMAQMLDSFAKHQPPEMVTWEQGSVPPRFRCLNCGHLWPCPVGALAELFWGKDRAEEPL